MPDLYYLNPEFVFDIVGALARSSFHNADWPADTVQQRIAARKRLTRGVKLADLLIALRPLPFDERRRILLDVLNCQDFITAPVIDGPVRAVELDPHSDDIRICTDNANPFSGNDHLVRLRNTNLLRETGHTFVRHDEGGNYEIWRAKDGSPVMIQLRGTYGTYTTHGVSIVAHQNAAPVLPQHQLPAAAPSKRKQRRLNMLEINKAIARATQILKTAHEAAPDGDRPKKGVVFAQVERELGIEISDHYRNVVIWPNVDAPKAGAGAQREQWSKNRKKIRKKIRVKNRKKT